MYLSRLILNPSSRDVRRDLGNCQELHRRAMVAFPAVKSDQDVRAQLGVLYRVDTNRRTGRTTVLVQSRHEPNWKTLPAGYLLDTGGDPENPDYKLVDEAYSRLQTGMALRFRLRANPTKKVDTKSGPDGRRRNGKRAELTDETERLVWLQRKGQQTGFEVLSVSATPEVLDVRIAPEAKQMGWRRQGPTGEYRRVTFASVLFEGVLQVTDAEGFRRALEQGIGPAKAYGCGLLSVASFCTEVQP